jgi:hypothetical protein
LPSQPLTLSTESAIEAVLVTAFLWRSEDARSNAGPPRKLRGDGMSGRNGEEQQAAHRPPEDLKRT